MLKQGFSRVLAALFLVLTFVSQETWALAGSTGALVGSVTDDSTKQPLVGAKVTAASASQIATTTTDGSGHFTLLNLVPDTYVLSVERSGFDTSSITGVTIIADNSRTLAIPLTKSLATIVKVRTRAVTSLVKNGVTADEYSIDAVTQAKVAAAGGGGNLDSAFSALATVPGAYVMPGQAGYVGAAPSLSIRGGDYDQIGYEIDGVPINRSFDNYPSGPTSSLGQQELQVYTGAPPADSQSDGISGYINQVIRTGSLPGSFNVTTAVGGPGYYHKIAVEAEGATQDRRFSYYVGLGGYNQVQRVVDNYDGASLTNAYGVPVGFCGAGNASVLDAMGNPIPYTPKTAPSCFGPGGVAYSAASTPLNLASFAVNAQSQVADRDNIVNLHYYFPHKDGSRDDLQFLLENNLIDTGIESSTNDQGGAAFLSTVYGVAPQYVDGYTLHLPTGGVLPANAQKYAGLYYVPDTPAHPFDGTLPPNEEDSLSNAQAIEKVQFTKSLGSNAFLRAYGYAYYSNFEYTGANGLFADANIGALSTPPDYELSSHTRGVDLNFTDQINAQNLLALDASYTTANVVRSNNTQSINGFYGPDSVNNYTIAALLVDSKNPTNGLCYNVTGAQATTCLKDSASSGAGAAYNVYDAAANPTGASFITLQQLYNNTYSAAPATTCGTGACEYLVVGNGAHATFNTVTPKFYGASLTDQFHPTSRLTLNAGIRLDDYQFVGGDTSGGNARAFFYNAYNREECIDTTSALVVSKASLGVTPDATCPTGTKAANFTNPTTQIATYPVFQPRLGATYSLGPSTVLRASYGRYAEAPNSAFEQYNVLQANAPAQLYGTYGFQQYGFTTPNHAIPPATSSNYDFSIEHQFPGQVSIKLTPFVRSTQNQNEQFFLDRETNFVSGLNVGNQTSKGFEFELDKGNFSQEGLSAKLSFAYTNSTIKYNTLSNGTTVLQPVVDGINAYNALTKKGGGSPCYTVVTDAGGGTADPACAAGDVANPYYNAPEQSLAPYAAGATSIPYSTIPAGVAVSATAIGAPYVTSLVLNEKIKQVSIAPVVQYFAGTRYGSPLASQGIDPTTCTGVLAGTTTGDPRYSYGAAGGSPYDAGTCGQLGAGIPNPQTGGYDGIGAFAAPSQIVLGAQISYEASKNFTLTANMANLVNTCFGGTKVPWAVPGACGYTVPAAGLEGAAGNVYNPGETLQPLLKSAYTPTFTQQPFGIFVTGNFKL